MRGPSAAVLVGLALVGLGCRKSPSLEGKWTLDANGTPIGFEFKPDKTFSMGMKFGSSTATATGDYKLEGETLTLTTKDMQSPGISKEMLQQAAAKSPALGLNQPKKMQVRFVSDDEVSVSGEASPITGEGAGAGKSATLKRVKESS